MNGAVFICLFHPVLLRRWPRFSQRVARLDGLRFRGVAFLEIVLARAHLLGEMGIQLLANAEVEEERGEPVLEKVAGNVLAQSHLPSKQGQHSHEAEVPPPGENIRSAERGL